MLVNDRTPGLAGTRNTGILALDTDLIAFCDDDDTWRPGKLRAQVDALRARPGAEFASCAIEVEYAGATHPRLAGRDEVTHADLLRSRMVMVHSSTYLARRAALTGGIGLVDETDPGQPERGLGPGPAGRPAAARSCTWTTPLVRVAWGASSHYARQWQTRADSLLWMLAHHPEMADSRPGAARVYGQLVVRLCVPAAAGGRVPVGVAGGARATGTSAGSRSRWRSRRAWCRGRRCCGT